MIFRNLAAALTLACVAAAAHGDSLPVTEPVSLRSDTLPAVDRVVVKKTERRLLPHARRGCRALLPRGTRPLAGRPEGALGRLPHARGRLPSRRAQSPQRLLPVDQGLLSQRGGPQARPRASLGYRRLDHDPRAAEPHEARSGLLPEARLDRRLHRRVQRRHGGDLDAGPDRYRSKSIPRSAAHPRPAHGALAVSARDAPAA